jgi:hypothetical protein
LYTYTLPYVRRSYGVQLHSGFGGTGEISWRYGEISRVAEDTRKYYTLVLLVVLRTYRQFPH